jgi:Uma2 family endonuclease
MQGQWVSERPPRTIMEVFQMLPEGTLAELIDSIIYMSPSPTRQHQRLILKLASTINSFVEEKMLGEVNVAPYDVYLDEHSNAVQPDIVFVKRENLSIIHDHIHGVPDLIVEVLSPGNKEYDMGKKLALYEHFGVQEYWIIDALTKEAIGYQPDAQKKYVVFSKSTAEIHSALLGQVFRF